MKTTRSEVPHLQQKQKPRKSSTKVTRDLNKLDWTLYPRSVVYAPYAERSEQWKTSTANAFYRRMARIRRGKTPSDRMKLRALKRADKRVRDKRAGLMKQCTHCLITKAHVDFDKQMDATHPEGMLRPYCRDCRKKKNAEAYQRRKDRQNDT